MENSSGRGPFKLEQTQQQVNEIVNIMKVNVEKVLEREQKLPELHSRAEALHEGGKGFKQQAEKLKKKLWWKNIKMMLVVGLIGVIILIIIIVSLINSGGDNSNPAVTTRQPTQS